MTRIAAVFSIGKSAGACEFALREILARESERVHVYLFYGEPAEGQLDSPLAAVTHLHSCDFGDRVVFELARATHAFSLDRVYAGAMDFVREIQQKSYDRVYLGITGGANPMVAALFHAAMSELHGDVIPVYVQSNQAASPGDPKAYVEFIISNRTRDRILLERVLKLARNSRLPLAAELVADLPKVGRAGFVRSAVTALAAWDDFRYEAALDLKSLADRAQDFGDDPALLSLVETIQRYASFARHCLEMENVFSNPDRFYAEGAGHGWKARVENCAVWLPIDALANAVRRAAEGRYTDALLRAYRAVEIAIQNRLFALGVHPSRLRWQDPPLSPVRQAFAGTSEPPSEVAFELGLKLLGLLTGQNFANTKNDRMGLQSARNLCYLEHGYVRITQKSCESSLAKARLICEQILGPAALISERLSQLAMDF